MPWEGTAPPFGFSTNDDTWLPMPAEWASLTVEAQEDDADSTLALFRRAIALRHGRAAFDGSIEWLDMPAGALAFRGADGLLCVLNTGSSAIALPDGAVSVSSGVVSDGTLPPNTAAWLT
jgi:alpha-glucosidase